MLISYVALLVGVITTAICSYQSASIGSTYLLLKQKHASEGAFTPRIAIALAGQIRTLSEQDVLDNLREVVVEPLRATVFLHVSAESTYTWQANNWVNYVGKRAENVQAIREALRPVYMNVTDDVDISEVRFELPQARLMKRWFILMTEILKHERDVGLEFDWVIRTRPDLAYNCRLLEFLPFAHNEVNHASQAAYLFWDFIAIIPRPVLEIALGMVLEAQGFVPCLIRTELCLHAVLEKHSIPYYLMLEPFVHLVRYADCVTYQNTTCSERPPVAVNRSCAHIDYVMPVRDHLKPWYPDNITTWGLERLRHPSVSV